MVVVLVAGLPAAWFLVAVNVAGAGAAATCELRGRVRASRGRRGDLRSPGLQTTALALLPAAAETLDASGVPSRARSAPESSRQPRHASFTGGIERPRTTAHGICR